MLFSVVGEWHGGTWHMAQRVSITRGGTGQLLVGQAWSMAQHVPFTSRPGTWRSTGRLSVGQAQHVPITRRPGGRAVFVLLAACDAPPRMYAYDAPP